MKDDKKQELEKLFENERIQKVEIDGELKKSFISYAMAVNVSRAIPDVRDGLKPVHRRILFSMGELNLFNDKPFKKSARIVGEVMGKYHPHGDSSIYGSLVNMAQEWNFRYPLVDGHGNFGSEDGDGAAAMRYTEARLSKISMELLSGLDKNTVDFIPNFDETEMEPTVLPARFPNLLVNGTTGIAVGMATNIPPHNLREVISAVVKIIDNKINEDRETEIDEILPLVKAPDFPTGGTILGTRGVEEAYRTGRGKIKVRAVCNIETLENGKTQIIVTELPYMVNKAKLIEKIAELHKDKKIDGLTDIRDESNREGTRVVIELRRDVNANVFLNKLYKHTQLQDTFGVIMLALTNNQPKVMNLLDILLYYLKHQEEVVTRRTQFDLDEAERKDHILQGLLIALDNIDEVISIIRNSANTPEAKEKLIERFGLSDAQSQAIVDMRLKTLTGLESEKIEEQHRELVKLIGELKAILGDKKILLGVIKDEITTIAEKFGDDRRTKIGFDDDDISIEDMIPDENVVIAMTNLGYIKRMTMDNFHSQNRGGKGIKGMSTINDDYIEDLLMTNTHNDVMFYTNLGRVYRLRGYEIPEAGRTARGTAIINLLQLQPGEKISAMIPLTSIEEHKNLFFITKKGICKKTSIQEFANIRKNGLIAININEDDELIDVKTTDKDNMIFIVTKNAMCIEFKETDVRCTSRNSIGVKGINLDEGDEVVGMQIDTQGESLLLVTENGIGKRTSLDKFRVQKRGGKGLRCYKLNDKTGHVVGVKAVNDNHEIMMITNEGIIIQIRMSDLRELGRVTSGVKLMDLAENVKIAKIAKVRDEISEDEAVINSDKVNDNDFDETDAEVSDED